MDVWLDTNWFAVNTKPFQEETAAMHIGRLKLEVLLPRVNTNRSVFGTEKSVAGALFPCYLFAKFSPKDSLHSIRYARGVRKVVSAGDVPIPVDQTIINSVRSRMDSKGLISLVDKQFHVGDVVLIQDGFMQGQKGIFERELSGQQRVMILLRSIEYQARVLVEKRFLGASVPETV
jgi:transcriptional antiterminator RfaH